MQTFVPLDTFSASVESLDDRRLGKQRVETMQILNALLDPQFGWQQHAAVTMWRGHSFALCIYGIECCLEWRRRGFYDAMYPQFVGMQHLAQNSGDSVMVPEWWGNGELHRSHRSNLVYKDFDHYSPLFPDADVDMEYVWPGTKFPPISHDLDSVEPDEEQRFCRCRRGETAYRAVRTRKGSSLAKGPGTWWLCVRCSLTHQLWLNGAHEILADSLFEGGPVDGQIMSAHELSTTPAPVQTYDLQSRSITSPVDRDELFLWRFKQSI